MDKIKFDSEIPRVSKLSFTQTDSSKRIILLQLPSHFDNTSNTSFLDKFCAHKSDVTKRGYTINMNKYFFIFNCFCFLK